MADPTVGELRAALDVALAQRDRALRVVDKLEAMASRAGGYTSYAEQGTVRDARALLAEHGIRTTENMPEWCNRG